MRQSLRLSRKCEDHFDNSHLAKLENISPEGESNRKTVLLC